MRKRRTREHIIADLSVNHVERFVLRCGYVVEPFFRDYGYDLGLYTFDENGEREPGLIFFQLKATDTLQTRQSDGAIVQVIDLRDMELWCREDVPVILVVYDASNDRAYWLHIQATYALSALPQNQATISLALPNTNVVNEEAIRRVRELKVSELN